MITCVCDRHFFFWHRDFMILELQSQYNNAAVRPLVRDYGINRKMALNRKFKVRNSAAVNTSLK